MVEPITGIARARDKISAASFIHGFLFILTEFHFGDALLKGFHGVIIYDLTIRIDPKNGCALTRPIFSPRLAIAIYAFVFL